MSNSYSLIKNIFIDDSGIFDYVNLDKSTYAYHKVISALKKPLKLVLFYGKPGSGKTFLLNKIYRDLSKSCKVVFFPQPFFNESDFVNAIYEDIFEAKFDVGTCENLVTLYKQNFKINKMTKIPEVQTILLLDEAQLYPDILIEKIRLLADTRCFKILFTVHKTGEQEDTLAKDYFKTRIWDNIELDSSTYEEVVLYIEKKLSFHGFEKYCHMYNEDQLKMIHKFTNGNLRILNKFLFKVYEILEYYEENQPSKIRKDSGLTKVLEMAALDAELLHA